MTQARDLADGKFDTNTLVVDAANNRVGAGTASPSHLIHAVGADSTNMIVAENATGVKTAISHGTNDGRIGNVTNHGLVFTINNAEKARITTAGQFRLQSSGITFNNDTGTANELDDYEEGTWTPVLDFGGSSTGIAYDTQSAIYTKIGRLVVVAWRIYLTSKGSATGHAHISGFPYAAASTPTGGVFQYISNRGNLNLSDEHAYLYFLNSVSRFGIYQGDNDGTGNGTVGEATFNNNAELEGFMQYTTSS